MIIERLSREMVMVEKARNATPRPNPNDLQLGPKVLLMDEFSASDGDIFPYRFKTDHLGKLIGKRSWGGVVGIRGSLPFVDGGSLMKPEFAPYAKDGSSWVIEGHGVDPDIVVDNDPGEGIRGRRPAARPRHRGDPPRAPDERRVAAASPALPRPKLGRGARLRTTGAAARHGPRRLRPFVTNGLTRIKSSFKTR